MSKRDASGVTIQNHDISDSTVNNTLNFNNGDPNIAGPSNATDLSIKISLKNQSSKHQKLNFEDELCEGISIENLNIVVLFLIIGFFYHLLEILEHIEQPDYFLKKIKEKRLSIENITDTLMRLKNRLDKVNFEIIILATTRYWEVLNHIDDVSENNKLITWLINELPKDYITIKKMFRQENEYKENLLHYLSSKGDLQGLLAFLTILASTSHFTGHIDNEMNFEDFITAENDKGLNFLHIICSKPLENFQILEKILNWIITQFGLNTLENLICKVTQQKNDLVLIISRFQSALFFIGMFEWMVTTMYGKTKEILKHKNKAGKNFVQMTAKNNHKKIKKIVKPVYEKFEDLLLLEDMLCSKNNENQTLGHILVSSNPDSFYEILNFRVLNEELVKLILLTPGINDKTALDKISVDPNVFKKTFTLLKEKHNIEFVKKLLLSVDNKGNTFLIKNIEYKESEDILGVLNWMLTEYGPKFVQDLIEIKNEIGNHLIYGLDEDDEINALLKWMTENINKEFTLNLIQQQNDDGDTFLHHFSKILVIKLIYLIKNLYELGFDSEKLQKLYLCKNKNNESFLHQWARKIQQNQLIELFEVFVQYDKSCLRQLLVFKDKWNRTFLNELYSGKQNLSFEELYKYLIKHLDCHFVQDLLLSKDKDGNRFLNDFVWKKNFEDLEKLIQLLVRQFGKDFVQDFLIGKDRIRDTFLDINIQKNGFKDLEKLFQLLGSQFGEDFVQKLLISKNKTGSSFLSNFVWENGFEDLKRLFQLLVSQFGKDFVQDLLIGKDRIRDVCLDIIIHKNGFEDLEKIFQLLESHFGKEFVQDLLLSKNKDGETFLNTFVWII